MRVGLMIFVLTASVAFGQMTTDSLRSKYGNPLSRETFTVRPGLQVIADYAASGRVCRLTFPASLNVAGDPPPTVVTIKRVDQALEEVVPTSVRGEQTNQMIASASSLSFYTTEYQHVSISYTVDANRPGQKGETTVMFKDETCMD